MILQLNVLPDGSCARIFARAEESELPYQGVTEVKIWHNSHSSSLQTQFRHPSQLYVNDYVVEFESRMPFRAFCENFVKSEYNSPNKYAFLTHNCANAANYALKLADIDLKIGGVKMTNILLMNCSSIFRLPTPFLTPNDLFIAAAKYKVKQEIDYKLQLSLNAMLLKVAAKNNELNDELVYLVDEVIDLTFVEAKKYPHFVDKYCLLLEEVTKSIQAKTARRFDRQLLEGIKHRPLKLVVKLSASYVMSVVALEFISLLFFLQSMLSSESGSSQESYTQHKPYLFQICLALLALKAAVDTINYKPEAVETPLCRKAMKLLSRLEEMEPNRLSPMCAK